MSPTAALDATVTGAISKELEDKSPAERLTFMRSLAEQNGVTFDDKMVVNISDEQLERYMGDSKKAIAEVADKIERKYELNPKESRNIAEDALASEDKRRVRHYQDCVVAAKVFRAIARNSTGRALPGELPKAYEEEKEYLRSTGRETRGNALDVGTGSEGGYLSPEIWNTMVYENIARVPLLRRKAFWFPMESNIMRLPKITANVAASTTAEAATAGNGTRPTIAQATWTLKKLTVLTTPFSIELVENARPELVTLLTKIATIELNRKEDEVLFNSSDSAWTDLLDSSVNLYKLGNAGNSGKTNMSTITFDDCANAIYTLAEQYNPDEDVQGSGIVNQGEAEFYFNQKVLTYLLALKGTTNQYIWGNVQDLQSGRKIFGKNVRRASRFRAPPPPQARQSSSEFSETSATSGSATSPDSSSTS